MAQESAESPIPAEGQSDSIADSTRSTAGAVADKVSQAASQVGAAASSAIGVPREKKSPEELARSVYVGNLFFDVKEHDLRREFSKAGNVEIARVIHDHRGLSKGYANMDILPQRFRIYTDFHAIQVWLR